MTSKVLLGIALMASALFLSGLGTAPFVDPPEGFHAAVAWEMLRTGDWLTPHVDGVRYFDKPPLLYWLMATGFSLFGPSPWAARLWSALPAIGVAVTTAWIGLRLGSVRLGLLAGLIVTANLEMFLFARLVKPDLLFVFLILLAFAGFIEVYGAARRGGLVVFYAALGLAVLAKDLLGAVGPLAVVAVFFAITREQRSGTRWAPWYGPALLLAIALPWYLLVEWRNAGFLWYTIVDNHVLNALQQRAFPDEDVPLTTLEFLGVTALGFLPWSLALPWAVWRALRGPWQTPEQRMWLLLGMWTMAVLGVFALSPVKLPHYGLPAFPAMALLVARIWNNALDGDPDDPTPRALLLPALAMLIVIGAAAFLASQGQLPLPAGALNVADVAARNMAARGQEAPFAAAGDIQPILGTIAAVFTIASAAVAAALLLARPLVGLGVLLAAMVAFLPLTAQGFTMFAKSRSVRALAEAVAVRATARDVLAHEGPLENSASWLLMLDRPVRIVRGRESSLAIGGTFAEARDVFWDGSRLREAWQGGERVFLVSAVRPELSVLRDLPPERVHLLAQGGGRRLYSNRP
jgi:4-amino-4-deoxy-L-arabinose transferase-like glycosyltransferase